MHLQLDDVQNADVPVNINEEEQIGGSMDDNINNRASKNQESKLAKALAICTIAGMGIINVMSSLPMPMMNTYLTNVWNLSLTNAAGIVNIWEGSSMILPIVVAYLSDTLMSIYPVHLMRTIVYTIGLGLLAMSTTSVFSKFTGTCSDDQPECIGRTQLIMFFTSLALMAVGIPDTKFLKTELQLKKIKIHPKLPDSDKLSIIVLIIGAIGGTIFSGVIKTWSLLFGIPAIFCIAATSFLVASFIAHSGSRPKERNPEENLLTNMARVLVASAFKISQKLPDDPAQLYENIDQSNVHSLSHTPGLRWLDKAAIILPNESQKENKWKLCTVTQVEETKLVIRTIPMFISFTFCGLVKSIGNTYFLEQANNMNRKLGNLKLPFLFLPMLHELMKLYWESTLKQRTATYSVIVNSVVCCTIAASVERRRLHDVRRHDLLDYPEEEIPMSVLWLVPQFFFLSMLDSYLKKSVENLFPDEIPLSRRKYLIHFAHGASGVGTVSGVLSVYVVGKISEIGGKNWFQYTLNRSRLDRYYWTLSALGALNIIVSVLSSWKIVLQFLSYVGES
ncbi:Protein NRT1/PTR FAMILY 5.5 [Abeliophyllum distichum]|uniref:Protein NRT1/PTR FAMILY 5.5 n=1 Tax=Abeliophyllum distichum TaxID=126358 RepID=A0ABD1R8K8_9LAMI